MRRIVREIPLWHHPPIDRMLSIVAALMSLVLPGGAGQATASLRVPTPIGTAPGFSLPAAGDAVRAARPVAGLECRTATAPGTTVHLELFARGQVVIVPAGVGVAPPVRREGAHVTGGRCMYPIHTLAPTGVVQVPAGRPGDARPVLLGLGPAAGAGHDGRVPGAGAGLRRRPSRDRRSAADPRFAATPRSCSSPARSCRPTTRSSSRRGHERHSSGALRGSRHPGARPSPAAPAAAAAARAA